jgi:hypothetical protein
MYDDDEEEEEHYNEVKFTHEVNEIKRKNEEVKK